MKIKEVKIKKFKRFTDLTISNIPQDAKVVILAGPNGCGKSSVFEAFNTWHRHSWRGQGRWDGSYHEKKTGEIPLPWSEAVQVSFFDPQPQTQEEQKKAIYIRSAYRNDPEFQHAQLSRHTSALEENRLPRLIDNDASVGLNYQRLASQGLEDIYEKESPDTTIGAFREQTIGAIRDATSRLFPNLSLNSLGNPLTNGTFLFDKGTSKAFPYKNLSGGEKAAFDLLLDIIVKGREFDNTVFCIDEPEAHMNTRLQAELLNELYSLISNDSQLWLATHSIGMMRRARDLASANPNSVVFLDFDERDFDQEQRLEPVKPDRGFWHRVLNVALDDLAELVAPNQVVVCEGCHQGDRGGSQGFDASIYDIIFRHEFPDTKFISSGNARDVETDRLALIEAITALSKGTKVIRLIDRDDRSSEQITHSKTQGVRVLSRRHIESYLFDDCVLKRLCDENQKLEMMQQVIAARDEALEASKKRGNPVDDMKSAGGDAYIAIKKLLGLSKCGNDARSFMRDTLTPLISENMPVYQELRADIFGY